MVAEHFLCLGTLVKETRNLPKAFLYEIDDGICVIILILYDAARFFINIFS